METRTIAMLALVLVVVAIVGLAIHVVIPTPPAHQPNRLWTAWRGSSMSMGSSSSVQQTSQPIVDASMAGAAS